MDCGKKLPTTPGKTEIKLKSSPKAEAVKRAPDEVVAMAIRDAMLPRAALRRKQQAQSPRVRALQNHQAARALQRRAVPNLLRKAMTRMTYMITSQLRNLLMTSTKSSTTTKMIMKMKTKLTMQLKTIGMTIIDNCRKEGKYSNNVNKNRHLISLCI